MPPHAYTAIVTLVSVLVYFWMSVGVSAVRRKTGISAPTMTGDPLLERTIRAHINTLEWLPIYLPSLWLFAIYWSDVGASVLGALWVVGRIIYFLGYQAEASRRAMGFYAQALAVAALLFGALGRILYLLATG